jgi:voltage-gated potassium channel
MPTLLTVMLTRIKRSQIIALLVLGGIALVVGAILFALTQHISIGMGFYWAIETATTVGYGDVTPHNTIGRFIAVGVMVTTIPLVGSAFALFAAAATASRLSRLLHVVEDYPKEGFVAIYGSHPTAARIAEEVERSGSPVIVVADENLDMLPPSIHALEGDPTLEKVVASSHPENASRVLIAPKDDKDALIIAVILRHLAPHVPAIAVIQSARIASALRDLGIEATVSAEELLGHTLAKSIETPHASAFLLDLVSSREYRFEELPTTPDQIGKPLSTLRDESEGLVLALVHDDTVELGLSHDPIITAQDRLLILNRMHIKHEAHHPVS